MTSMKTKAYHIVVGGNRGIGLEIVRRLLEQLPKKFPEVAHTIVVTARDRDACRGAIDKVVKETSSSSDGQEKIATESFALEVTDEASVAAFQKDVEDLVGKNDHCSLSLIHNAGFAFSMTSSEPFATQAKVTNDVNYFGAVRVSRALVPLIAQSAKNSREGSPPSRIVFVSSTSGETSYSSLSTDRKAELDSLIATPPGSSQEAGDGIAKFIEGFVDAAQTESHKAAGYPSTAYGMSKCALTAYSRVLHKTIAKELGDATTLPVVSCCPGFCRTSMTLKNRWSPTSWLFFAASWVVGQSAYAGADTPVWLALDPEAATMGGKFVRDRRVIS